MIPLTIARASLKLLLYDWLQKCKTSFTNTPQFSGLCDCFKKSLNKLEHGIGMKHKISSITMIIAHKVPVVLSSTVGHCPGVLPQTRERLINFIGFTIYKFDPPSLRNLFLNPTQIVWIPLKSLY